MRMAEVCVDAGGAGCGQLRQLRQASLTPAAAACRLSLLPVFVMSEVWQKYVCHERTRLSDLLRFHECNDVLDAVPVVSRGGYFTSMFVGLVKALLVVIGQL